MLWVGDFFPAQLERAQHEHVEHRAEFLAFDALFATLKEPALSEKARDEALASLKEKFVAFKKGTAAHLKGEENDINPIGKKYTTYAMQKQLLRECWELTGVKKWRSLLVLLAFSVFCP